jgi:hypothetical protein
LRFTDFAAGEGDQHEEEAVWPAQEDREGDFLGFAVEPVDESGVFLIGKGGVNPGQTVDAKEIEHVAEGMGIGRWQFQEFCKALKLGDFVDILNRDDNPMYRRTIEVLSSKGMRTGGEEPENRGHQQAPQEIEGCPGNGRGEWKFWNEDQQYETGATNASRRERGIVGPGVGIVSIAATGRKKKCVAVTLKKLNLRAANALVSMRTVLLHESVQPLTT